MMKKFLLQILCCTVFFTSAFAQDRTISGTVTDKADGQPLPGVSVKVKGTQVGTVTDANGKFQLKAANNGTLTFTYIGYVTQELPVGTTGAKSVALVSDSKQLGEVVVTGALGIQRTRNQETYAAQQVVGDEVSKTRSNNFVNGLSGKVAGLEIRQNNTMGGSSNVVLRGVKSITGNNQALFVIDGVPVDNTNTSGTNQSTGRGGYDYGNAAADLNPDNIESVTVLKGAAASALYGSRGSNGVILITSKKGKNGLGITVNSSVSVGAIDKTTFAKYQKEYGGGYGAYYENDNVPTTDPAYNRFLYRDINGDGQPDLVAPMQEDASYGGKFNPNLLVYQWDAFDPSSPNFGKPRPWVAAQNDPSTFFEKPVSYNQSIFITNGSEQGNYKLGFTRNDEKGVLPNSNIAKNLVDFSANYNINKKLTVGAAINFSNINGRGRYGTGYNDRNVAGNFRQWYQTNVDIQEQKDAYFRSGGKNVTWNWADPDNLKAIYWDNPYFSRYQNFETDTRNRYLGNINATYKATNWLSFTGRISVDSYAELQEERQAITSTAVPFYTRFNRTYSETNYDLLANFDKKLSDDFTLKGLIGTNIRKQKEQSILASTNGGLVIPGIYSLQNSVSALEAPVEFDGRREVDGVFAGATLAWKNMITLDGTIRRDASSTLPKGNNVYYYPSVAGGFVFSELLKDQNWLSYGKLRANYAQVGADANYFYVTDTYRIVTPFDGNPQATVFGTKNNPNLKPERTNSQELGLEMAFLKNRVGFDVSYYQTKTFDQILPVTVSVATGYTSKYLNAGTIQNRGVELSVNGTPLQTKDFSWRTTVNWTRNRNKVTELFRDATGQQATNLQLATFQGGVTLNATLGQPYGTLRGSNFVYYGDTGQPIVNANGRYAISPTANEVIGNVNPDWIGGVNNSFRYKNFNLSFLIDVRKGGSVFSLDRYYGLATGLYPETAGLNDLGNPSRNPISQGGGVIMPGVTATGAPNTVRVSNSNYGTFGYVYNPAGAFVYDASYVKLREAVIGYSLPRTLMAKLGPVKGIDLSLIGRNLWIIHKNLPYADPEEGLSSGNFQGYQSGAYPTVRTFTFNAKITF